MKYRALGSTDLTVSEVGFGVWSVSTDWWGKIEEEAGIGLLGKAIDLGINYFDTADSYSAGYGEEILAKAFGERRHDIVIATKVGYDFYSTLGWESHKEPQQNFTPEFIRFACEQSLRRLDTDYIDLYQLHDPGLDSIEADEVFYLLDLLVSEGKVRYYGAALGPGVGWFDEGEAMMRHRNVPALQIIYSIIDQDPAQRLFPIAEEQGAGLVIRAPHAAGILDGTLTEDTVFDTGEPESHGSQQWLDQSLHKQAVIQSLVGDLSSTIGQAAIKFALSGPQVATVLPNITSHERLLVFAAAPETEDFPQGLLDQLHELYEENFGLEPCQESSSTT